jgi:hypothetical protein
VFGAPLPIDLTPVGATACSLAVDPLVPLLTGSDAIGGIDQSLPIPANTLLLGAEFVAQGFVLDATVGPLGLAATPAVAFRIF